MPAALKAEASRGLFLDDEEKTETLCTDNSAEIRLVCFGEILCACFSSFSSTCECLCNLL